MSQSVVVIVRVLIIFLNAASLHLILVLISYWSWFPKVLVLPWCLLVRDFFVLVSVGFSLVLVLCVRAQCNVGWYWSC